LLHFDRKIADYEPWLWLTTAFTSVGPELAGIFIGATTLDYLNEKRQRNQLRDQLVRQMGSSHNEVADSATRELAAHGWLTDGALNNGSFVKANLSGCDLSRAEMIRANLEGALFCEANLMGALLIGAHCFEADFQHARLNGARMDNAHLQSATFDGASLEGVCFSGSQATDATFVGANLQNAIFVQANLASADFAGADLSFADLSDTDVTVEQLKQAKSLTGTTMPDKVQIGTIRGPSFDEWYKNLRTEI
jgi:uncharacterized protein YjbI with pentapeptide repeats